MKSLYLICLLYISNAQAQKVIFYKDINFSGGSIEIDASRESTVNHINDRVGFPGNIFTFGDPDVCNDEISSFRIPPNVTVFAYEHENLGGARLELTGDRANMVEFIGWNDRISSFRIVPNVTTSPMTNKPLPCSFINFSGSVRYIRYVIIGNGESFEICQHTATSIPIGKGFTVNIPFGKACYYETYSQNICDHRYKTASGTAVYSQNIITINN